MTGGLLGFVLTGVPSTQLGSVDSSITYNGFKLEITEIGVRTEVEGTEYFFSAFPFDVDFLEVEPEIINLLTDSNMVVFTSNATSEEATVIGGFVYDIGQIMQAQGSFAQVAFTTENEFDFPVKTCNHATEFVPVMFIQRANNTAIRMVDNCVIINGSNSADLLRIKDRLGYGILGVIE